MIHINNRKLPTFILSLLLFFFMTYRPYRKIVAKLLESSNWENRELIIYASFDILVINVHLCLLLEWITKQTFRRAIYFILTRWGKFAYLENQVSYPVKVILWILRVVGLFIKLKLARIFEPCAWAWTRYVRSRSPFANQCRGTLSVSFSDSPPVLLILEKKRFYLKISGAILKCYQKIL